MRSIRHSPRTDVTLVSGLNDATNPVAKNEPGSPIYGMPILEVYRSAVIVLKPSMASGFAGIGNPLFIRPQDRAPVRPWQAICERHDLRGKRGVRRTSLRDRPAACSARFVGGD